MPMFVRVRGWLAVLITGLITLAGLATGIVLGCNGNYCNTLVDDCWPLKESAYDTCCLDSDGDGIRHCIDCWRRYYWCAEGRVKGPAYSCSGSGGTCS